MLKNVILVSIKESGFHEISLLQFKKTYFSVIILAINIKHKCAWIGFLVQGDCLWQVQGRVMKVTWYKNNDLAGWELWGDVVVINSNCDLKFIKFCYVWTHFKDKKLGCKSIKYS